MTHPRLSQTAWRTRGIASPRFSESTRTRVVRYCAAEWRSLPVGERLSGKVALRYQPSRRVVLRAAAGTGFRAPGLSQVAFQKVITNVIADQFIEVGVFPVDHPASVALGARPLTEETSVSLSAGVAFTPVDNLTVTADVFHIDIDDRIILGATFDDDASVQLLADAGITDVGGV